MISGIQRRSRFQTILAILGVSIGTIALVTIFESPASASVFTSITNSDGTLTISPAIGNVVASINLANANTWTAMQTIDNVAGAGSGDLGTTIGHFVCLDQSTCTTGSSIFFETGGGVFVIDAGDSGNGNNPCKLDFRTNAIERMGFDTNACGTAGSVPLSLYESVNKYANIATTGTGLVPVYASYSATGKTAGVSNFISYTPPATAGTYRLCWTVETTTSTTDNFHLAASWDGATGSEQSQVLGGTDPAGSALVAGAITNVIGNGVYSGCTVFQIDNSADSINVSTGGTFTTVVYNISAELEQLQ